MFKFKHITMQGIFLVTHLLGVLLIPFFSCLLLVVAATNFCCFNSSNTILCLVDYWLQVEIYFCSVFHLLSYSPTTGRPTQSLVDCCSSTLTIPDSQLDSSRLDSTSTRLHSTRCWVKSGRTWTLKIGRQFVCFST